MCENWHLLKQFNQSEYCATLKTCTRRYLLSLCLWRQQRTRCKVGLIPGLLEKGRITALCTGVRYSFEIIAVCIEVRLVRSGCCSVGYHSNSLIGMSERDITICSALATLVVQCEGRRSEGSSNRDSNAQPNESRVLWNGSVHMTETFIFWHKSWTECSWEGTLSRRWAIWAGSGLSFG